MAKGPDPNRSTPADPEAMEDDGLGMHESPASSGVRWLMLIAVALLALVLVLVMV